MPYNETRPPTSSERELIYQSFSEIVKRCYPDCRYIDDSDPDNIYVQFFSEVEIVEEEQNPEKERVGAVVGGQGAEIDDLRLFVDIEKWRAQPSEFKLLLLIHEATHVEHAEHGDGFWENFVANLQTVLDEGPYASFPEYTEQDLWIAAVHHPTPHSCDGDWTRYERQEWLINRLPYSQDDFETFEKLAHPTTDHSELSDFRKMHDKLIAPDTEAKPRISFFPIRNKKISNTTVCPEYIESPCISEFKVRTYLNDLRERGYPPIPVPVVELTPSGQYRIINGEIAVAVAQRIGFPEVGVVNTDQDYETAEKYRSELPG